MTPLTFKIVAFFAIFATGLIGGLMARRLAGSARSELLFSLGNAFAGGIFLGAGLIHMLPDAEAGFASLTGSDYPWFALVCSGGFLLILFLEKVLVQRQVVPGVEDAGRAQLKLYPYVLMLVLSLHSVITGIALGTEERIAQVVVILIAVVAHKGTAAFALTVSLLRAAVARPRVIAMVALFSLMTPLGIVLGIGFMRLLSGTAEAVFEAGFDALAAGTFLYVALLDILGEEFRREQNRSVKFAFVLVGLVFMALIAAWT